MIYRWIIAFYFLGWLITAGVRTADARWFIYLTNWSIVGFNIYLILAALSVTTKFVSVHIFKTADVEESRSTQYNFDKPIGCCGYGNNRLSWYQMIHWASFSVFGEIALAILILFWSILYSGGPVGAVSIHHHLVNGVLIVVDLLFFGVPVSLLHVIYPVSFAATYSSFNVIYWGANGTNPFNGERYVYSVLDYSLNPTLAVILVVAVTLLFMPFVHLIFYSLYLARFWLVYAIYGRSHVSCWGEKATENRTLEMEQKTEENV